MEGEQSVQIDVGQAVAVGKQQPPIIAEPASCPFHAPLVHVADPESIRWTVQSAANWEWSGTSPDPTRTVMSECLARNSKK
jgi:hypothetical protein